MWRELEIHKIHSKTPVPFQSLFKQVKGWRPVVTLPKKTPPHKFSSKFCKMFESQHLFSQSKFESKSDMNLKWRLNEFEANLKWIESLQANKANF